MAELQELVSRCKIAWLDFLAGFQKGSGHLTGNGDCCYGLVSQELRQRQAEVLWDVPGWAEQISECSEQDSLFPSVPVPSPEPNPCWGWWTGLWPENEVWCRWCKHFGLCGSSLLYFDVDTTKTKQTKNPKQNKHKHPRPPPETTDWRWKKVEHVQFLNTLFLPL